MATHLDIQLLKAEESALLKISSKITEQLNRLKVEELALLSQIRKTADIPNDEYPVAGESSTNEPDEAPHTEQISNEPLDLRPSTIETGNVEEEEDEEVEQDQLTAFMKQLDK